MSKAPSKRDRVRAEAERLLRESGEPLHVSAIGRSVRQKLGIDITDKDVNTSLHDDFKRRFNRVSKGTWELRRGAT